MTHDSDHSDHAGPEAAEFVRSARGLWDGRGWVESTEAAIRYPARTRRAEVARRIVEEQTGVRCWVLAERPGFAHTAC